MHRKTLKFACTLCGREFRNSFCLSRHQERMHKRSGNLGCLICDYRTKKKGNLKRHCEAYHRGTGACDKLGYIACDICGKLLSSEQALNRHNDIHEAIAIGFACSICNEVKCEDHRCLFKCLKCAREVNSKLKLRRHEKVHIKVESVCHSVAILEDHKNVEHQLTSIIFD